MNKALFFVVVPALVALVMAQYPFGGQQFGAGPQYAASPYSYGLNPYSQIPGYLSAVSNYNLAQRKNKQSKLFTLFASFALMWLALNGTGTLAG